MRNFNNSGRLLVLSPSILKLGAIAPLPKDSKRFRPITLLEPITKLVTGTVARRMSLLFHTQSLLNHHQFGFVHGGPCEAPIEVANDIYEYAIEHDEQLHVAFLDAASAFDTVQHPALTAAFSSIGASTSFIRWIKFMVAGHRRVIRKAYSMGDPASEFTIESGTPQGDPLSPLFWATVVDFALRRARNAGAPGFTALGRTPCQLLLCYADDIALFANSRSPNYNCTHHSTNHSNCTRSHRGKAKCSKKLLRTLPYGGEYTIHSQWHSSHSALKGSYENSKWHLYHVTKLTGTLGYGFPS